MPEVAEVGGAVRFPFIPLSKALERAREINKNAGQHGVLVSDAKKLWGYSEKASGGDQTISAVKQYGLAADFGTKDRRQIKLTDDARRYFLDERPEVHDELQKKFAMLPKALANLWGYWRDTPPADPVARSTLKVEFGYAESAAAELLSIYKTNLVFAKLADHGDDSLIAEQATPTPRMVRRAPVPPPASDVKVGDYVQWTSNGVDQFKVPRKVVGLFPDGEHAQVFGSNTGISMSELTVTDPPAPGLTPPLPKQVGAGSAGAQGENEYSVLQRGNRLQITADVDLEGLETLKQMIAGYETILKLLAGQKPKG